MGVGGYADLIVWTRSSYLLSRLAMKCGFYKRCFPSSQKITNHITTFHQSSHPLNGPPPRPRHSQPPNGEGLNSVIAARPPNGSPSPSLPPQLPPESALQSSPQTSKLASSSAANHPQRARSFTPKPSPSSARTVSVERRIPSTLARKLESFRGKACPDVRHERPRSRRQQVPRTPNGAPH